LSANGLDEGDNELKYEDEEKHHEVKRTVIPVTETPNIRYH
jgi:hypothetical protein